VRTSAPRLIAPPVEEQPIYPYARVWRSLALFGVSLFVVTLVMWTLDAFVLDIERTLYAPIAISIALIPAGLWALFALLPERGALEPRRGLIAVFAVSALVANGITLPVIEGVLQIERWLPLADLVTRIIGYTIGVGVAHEISKYLVVRLLTWDSLLRARMDSIAYVTAAAVGYATALNLVTALRDPAAPAASAFAVFGTIAFSLAPSLIVGYGFGEARFSNPNAFLLIISFAMAALIFGVATVLRSNLVNAGFVLAEQVQTSAPSPIFGLAISVVLLLGMSIVVASLITSAERREAEIRAGEAK
jgi:hypothetical protein